jgi:hypothetical protein
MESNTLALHAINLGILTSLFFIIGMIKPKWAFFFLEKPSRWHVFSATLILVMITMTMWGEGLQQKTLAKKKQTQTSITAPAPVPVPVPVPIPAPEAAKKK